MVSMMKMLFQSSCTLKKWHRASAFVGIWNELSVPKIQMMCPVIVCSQKCEFINYHKLRQ